MTTKTLSGASVRRRAAPNENPQHSARWLILGVIAVAQLMIVLDVSIVNIALPSAQKALGFSNNDRQWIVTAYSLAFGSLLPLGGRIADLFGRRMTFLVGAVGFAAASALGGAAQNFEMLVTGRAIQGLFAALLAPAALSLLTTTFTDAKERAKAFGIFGAIAGSGAAVGLLLGGVLTEHLNWRWTLYVNLIFAVIAFIGGSTLLRHQPAEDRPKLDLFGTLLASLGLFGLVYGFSNAESHTWSSPQTWGFLVGSGVLLALFAWWQTKVSHPLLPMRVLLHRDRGASFLASLVSGAGMFGVFLFLTYYLEETLNYSPVMTGVAFLPMIGVLIIVASVATNALVPRIGPKLVVSFGMLLGAVGLLWLTQLDAHSGYAAHILPPLILVGIGMALIFPPTLSLATSGVAPEDAGVASAMVNTMQQVGGSIGTALLNTLATSAAAGYLVGRPHTPDVQVHAQLHSYATAYSWAAGIFALGAILTVLLYRRRAAVMSEQTTDAVAAVHM